MCASAYSEGVRPDVSVVSGDGIGDRGGGVMEMRVEQNRERPGVLFGRLTWQIFVSHSVCEIPLA